MREFLSMHNISMQVSGTCLWGIRAACNTWNEGQATGTRNCQRKPVCTYLEGVAQLQHCTPGADKLAAARQAALDDGKQLAAGLEYVCLLGILHRLPGLLPDQSLHCVTQLLLLSINVHTARTHTLMRAY